MEFSVETILTVLTGVCFEKPLDNMKRLIEHMTGEPATEITLWEGTRVNICKQYIVRQYPELAQYAQMNRAKITRENISKILEDIKDDLGTENFVIPVIENMPSPQEYFSNAGEG